MFDFGVTFSSCLLHSDEMKFRMVVLKDWPTFPLFSPYSFYRHLRTPQMWKLCIRNIVQWFYFCTLCRKLEKKVLSIWRSSFTYNNGWKMYVNHFLLTKFFEVSKIDDHKNTIFCFQRWPWILSFPYFLRFEVFFEVIESWFTIFSCSGWCLFTDLTLGLSTYSCFFCVKSSSFLFQVLF